MSDFKKVKQRCTAEITEVWFLIRGIWPVQQTQMLVNVLVHWVNQWIGKQTNQPANQPTNQPTVKAHLPRKETTNQIGKASNQQTNQLKKANNNQTSFRSWQPVWVFTMKVKER